MPNDSPTENSLPAPGRRSVVLRALLAISALAWLAGLAFGVERIWAYKATPGVNAVAPQQWPGSNLVSLSAGRSTLVMFVHPQCSCTRASLAELDSILRQSNGRLSAWVLFLHPPGTTERWEKSATWDTAQRMRGVRVASDDNGIESDRFGASTSGQVVLYDAQGRLQFSGGITGARGHMGANSGETRVISLANTGTADAHDHAVYGCGLHDPHPRTDTPVEGPT